MITMYLLESVEELGGVIASHVATYAYRHYYGTPSLEELLSSNTALRKSVLGDLRRIFESQMQGSNHQMLRLSRLKKPLIFSKRGHGELQLLPTRLIPVCTFDERGIPVRTP